MEQDALVILFIKIVSMFIIGLFVIFLISPIIGLFGIITTGNQGTDIIFLRVLPLGIGFFCIYRMFKVASA